MEPQHQSDRAAFVFGGSRGIGAAAVERLARDGFDVAFTYLSDANSAASVTEKVRSAGRRGIALRADSASPDQLTSAVAHAVAELGTIDAVVINAGILKVGTVDTFTLEDFDQMVAVNVRGVFAAVKAVEPSLNEGASIVTIGSNVVHRTGTPGASVYQMTKTAVAGLVKGLALDLAPRRVTVNNVQPGPTDTDMNTGAIDTLAGASPLGRVGQPEEIAGLISYLASPEASYMTGASLTIDGGFTL